MNTFTKSDDAGRTATERVPASLGWSLDADYPVRDTLKRESLAIEAIRP